MLLIPRIVPAMPSQHVPCETVNYLVDNGRQVFNVTDYQEKTTPALPQRLHHKMLW